MRTRETLRAWWVIVSEVIAIVPVNIYSLEPVWTVSITLKSAVVILSLKHEFTCLIIVLHDRD